MMWMLSASSRCRWVSPAVWVWVITPSVVNWSVVNWSVLGVPDYTTYFSREWRASPHGPDAGPKGAPIGPAGPRSGMPAIVRPVGDERDGLVTFLAHERHVLLVAAHGLTDEQARLTPTASELSI